MYKNQTKNTQISKISTIALTVILTFGILATSTLNFTVQAEDRKSYAFITAAPNPVGLGQKGPWEGVLVIAWVADPTPSATTGIGQFRTGYKVTITKPDGTTEFRQTGSTDPSTKFATNSIGRDIDYEGGAYFIYTPDQLGNYTLKFDYAGDVIYTPFPNGTRNWIDVQNRPADPRYNYTALPTSATYVLTVQQEPVLDTFKVPLPNEYWTRPIHGQNYWWSEVSSNWLMPGWNMTSRFFDQNGVFVPEGTVPKSAHILWSNQQAEGGLAGGIYNNVPYYSGLSYQMYDQPLIIIGDRIYRTTIAGGEPRGVSGGPTGKLGTEVIDKRTGKTLFFMENVTISYGQVLNFAGPNQAGTHAYLWSSSGTTRTLYDAWTGNKVVTIANVTSGTTTFGPKGEIIIYGLSYNNSFYGPGQGSWQVTKWNSSKALKAPQPIGTGTTSQDYSWRPYTNFTFGTVDGRFGVEWYKPAVNVSGYQFGGNGLSQGAFFGAGSEILAVRNRTTSGDTNINSKIGYNFAAYSMDTGDMLWQSEVLPVEGRPNTFQGIGSFGLVWGFSGNLYAYDHYEMQWLSWDIKSGKLKWITEPRTDPWAYYAQAESIMQAYDYLITAGFDGIARGYNLTTGKEEWRWFAGTTGYLTPYGHQTFYDGLLVADGKAIALPNEHGSGVEPLHQDLRIVVLDVRDKPGTLAWDILGYFDHPYLSDGMMFSHNNYDNKWYAFGKGPTATTVTAPNAGVTLGQSIVIGGTVTDISPGTEQLEQAKRFPNGVPAVSDESQTPWMEYVYMQQAAPTDVKGVEVTLTVVDSNGNRREIGKTTSDATGFYSFQWTPDVPGKYNLYASFAGSESYWPSQAETAFAADTAPPATQEPQAQSNMTDTYVLAGVAVIVIAIAIVGAILAILLKKRP
ncbi:MAG TPA: carboxypeptidase-like regulatory domain-containing protein [Candidatus Bathyarchaeia archaeon]|nr:carboxypeptidase-like regulatory domain-containing protein [Candidatus Bathyarchaeia archaeon]